MKIAYVRAIFPKNSETFVLEEIAQLKKMGHEIRIFSGTTELTSMHSKVLEFGLLDNAVYTHTPLSFIKTIAHFVIFFAKLLTSSTLRQAYNRNLLSQSFSVYKVFCLLHNNPKPRRFSFLLVHLFRALKILYLSSWTNNLSLAFNSYIRSFDSFSPDVIHAPFAFNWDSYKLAQLAQLYPSTPLTITLRSGDLYRNSANNASVYFRKWLLKYANSVITTSLYNIKIVQNLCPERSNIQIVHSSIDPVFFRHSVRLANAKRQIISIARFVPKKGLEYLVEACALLRNDGIEFNCLLIGDGPLRGKLQQLIQQYHLDTLVTMVGPYSNEEIRRELSHSKVFVLPCVIARNGDRDILPNSLKEAMAMQLPVVTSCISGIDELVTDNVDGLLVPPESPQAIADAVHRLFQDEQLAARLGAHARDKILTSFNINIEGEKLAHILGNAQKSKRIASTGQLFPNKISKPPVPFAESTRRLLFSH